MEFSDFLSPESILPDLRVTSKKQALQELSAAAARKTGVPERLIYDTLIERERLGTTGVGQGIAIPHGRLPKLDQLYGLFARLDKPIEFESIDGQPVDLIFVLLVPEGAGADHLKALAKVSRALRNRNMCDKLRGSDSADAIYSLFQDAATPHAA